MKKTFIAIFLIPVTFYVVERLGHKKESAARQPLGEVAACHSITPADPATGKEE